MNNASYIDNSIISLEENEENPYSPIQKNIEENPSSSKYSFFTTFFKSIGKIGQGLRNFMSKKINLGEEDENLYEQNLYYQKENRFNPEEEISLIEAPSFMKDSHSFCRYNIKNENISENNILNQDDNKMTISNIEPKIENYDNSFNKNDIFNKEDEEINNSSFLKDDHKKVKIQSTLLNKKRERKPILSSIIEEEDEKNNEDIFEEKKTQKINESKTLKNKSINNLNNSSINNISIQRNKNNSLMNISMKSIDSIKEEINQRREENSRHIKELYKKNELYYDCLKEEKMRQKILEEYYKDKAKRKDEVKLQMEREKKKKEEEYKKLKMRREAGLKFASLPKKPKVFAQIKNNNFNFSGKPLPQNQNNSDENKNNIMNFTFANNSHNSNEEQNSQKNETINKNNINNEQKPIVPSFNSSPDNKNEASNIKFDNKSKSIFGDLLTKNDNQPKEEKKPQQSLFSDTSKLFTDKTPTNNQLFNSGTGLFNQNQEKTKEEKQKTNFFSNENKNENKLFTPNNPNESIQNNIFSANEEKNESKSIFFTNNININNNKITENKNNEVKKDDLFNQQTAVSAQINTTSLFTTNKPETKGMEKSLFNQSTTSNNLSLFNNNENKDKPIEGLFSQPLTGNSLFSNNKNETKSLFGPSLFNNNQDGNKGQNQGNLLSKDNPFINASNKNDKGNLFGNNQQNTGQSQPNTFTLFGNN